MVVGEISNFKVATSGHRYFDLKDENAVIRCNMWRSRTLDFRPEDGMKVVIGGRLSVYAPRGSYSIDCAFMRPEGVGDLHAAFEALKKKLHAAGWFDQSRKKPLPRFPQRIGIVTSSTGAAIRDMVSTIERRYPALQVYLRHALVQGEGAEFDIAKGIAELDAMDLDVIIIGRGGGSIEDLWSFNTETVARAVLECSTPIISGVGHETDTTISDFVADVRAATPTASAELVTPITVADLYLHLDEMQEKFIDAVQENIGSLRETAEEFLDGTALRRIQERLTSKGERAQDLKQRLQRAISNNISMMQQNVRGMTAHLKSLHPHRPLKLGYAVVERNGKPVSAKDTLKKGDNLSLVRHQQRADITVDATEDIEPQDMDNG